MLSGSLSLFGQAPDCVIGFTFTATGQRSTITGCGHNTQGVYEWRAVYANTGFTALSLRIESSLAGVSWAAFNGTVNNGVNPNTSTTSASTDVSGFNEYVSVTLTSSTGAGTITGVLYGCRQPGCSVANATVTIPTPVPVDGPTAAGAAPTTPPVLIAGQDGSPGLIRTLKTDSNGSPIASNASVADADALSNTQLTDTGAAGGRIIQFAFDHVFNGATWDRLRGNTSGIFTQGPVADGATAAGNPVQVGGVDQLGVARHLSVNPNGDIAVGTQSATADAQANNWAFLVTGQGGTQAPAAVMKLLFYGATWDRDFNCPNRTNISLSAGTDVVIAAGVSSTNIRLCQVAFNGATVADFTIRQGTGTTCLTNTLDLASLGQVNGVISDFKSNNGTINTTIAARDVCVHSSASVTILGWATYAQF